MGIDAKLAIDAVKLLITTAMKAKRFHELYKMRDGELKTFAEYGAFC